MTTNLTSLNETARLLRIPPMNLSRWVRVYRIPTVKIGNVQESVSLVSGMASYSSAETDGALATRQAVSACL